MCKDSLRTHTYVSKVFYGVVFFLGTKSAYGIWEEVRPHSCFKIGQKNSYFI